MISRDRLRHNFTIRHVLDYDTARIAHIHTEELLSEGHNADAGRPGESYVHHSVEKLLVAVEEGVIEGDASLVRVEGLVGLGLEQVIVVLVEHQAHLGLDELRQPLLHV